MTGRRIYSKARLLLSNWGTTRRLAVTVKQTHGVSQGQQLLDLARFALKYGYSPEDYFRFRMYAVPGQAAYFLSLRTNIILRTYLYDALGLDPSPLADKRLFYRRCKDAGLPTPETLADFNEGRANWWLEPTLPASDLFVKEAVGLCGEGAVQWRWVGEGCWTERHKGKLKRAEIIQLLKADSYRAALLLQRRLLNHPELEDLGQSGLCTVRVVTMRSPQETEVEVLLSVFRIPASNAVVDNFAQGGLACPVDLNSGSLGLAVRKNLSLAHIDLARHPDTEASIVGRRLPLWDEVLKLAISAHREFVVFPSVGWDIAITPAGPILIEGNYNWDVLLAQQPGSRPLGKTAFVPHLRSWIKSATSRPMPR